MRSASATSSLRQGYAIEVAKQMKEDMAESRQGARAVNQALGRVVASSDEHLLDLYSQTLADIEAECNVARGLQGRSGVQAALSSTHLESERKKLEDALATVTRELFGTKNHLASLDRERRRALSGAGRAPEHEESVVALLTDSAGSLDRPLANALVKFTLQSKHAAYLTNRIDKIEHIQTINDMMDSVRLSQAAAKDPSEQIRSVNTKYRTEAERYETDETIDGGDPNLEVCFLGLRYVFFLVDACTVATSIIAAAATASMHAGYIIGKVAYNSLLVTDEVAYIAPVRFAPQVAQSASMDAEEIWRDEADHHRVHDRRRSCDGRID